MLTLVNILIVFFIILILYQLVLANHIIEGIENNQQLNNSDTSDPQNALILAQQNAEDIVSINQNINSIQGLYKEVQDISGNVVTLQGQVTSLVNAQKDYASNITGGTTPNITGTTDN